MNILVTGGAGFIGSHTIIALLKENYKVVILDNLSNSSEETLSKISLLIGKSLTFIKGDIRDYELIFQSLVDYKINEGIFLSMVG